MGTSGLWTPTAHRSWILKGLLFQRLGSAMFSWMAALDPDCGGFQSIPNTWLPKASLRAAWELRKFQRPLFKPTVQSAWPAQQPAARLGREG